MATLSTADARRELLERMVAEQPLRLLRKMRANGHDTADAEDLAQETVLRALRSIEEVHGPADEPLVCGWVDRIAANVSLNARRSLARQPKSNPLPLVDGTSGEFRADAGGREEAELIACQHSLGNLLEDLPHEQRVVFVARVLEERSTAQVAEELGISHDLVRWRLRTARKHLRARINTML